jgi:DNA adenine methylase
MNKIKTKITPVRYPGGKSNALKFLNNYLPKDFEEYREPFFGGGSVGLYLMQTCKNATYHINDLFYPVYCFWKILYEDPTSMVEFLLKKKKLYSNHTDAKELHSWCRTNIDGASEFDTACLWYILNKTSYSGMSMIGSYAKQAWDQNFSENCIANLPKVSDLMHSVENVKITNDDYVSLLNNNGKNVFIFLDPPYKIPHSLYGKDGELHRAFNHQKFLNNIKDCNHKWMITYNDDFDIKQWYSEYKQLPWSLTYTMKSAERTENIATIKAGNLARENNRTEKTGKEGKELLIWNW